MHELTIVSNMLRILQEQAERHQVDRIVKVRVKIGEFTAVLPEVFKSCFELLTQGTIAEGAQLEINNIPIRARCLGCSQVFDVSNFCFVCPECGNGKIDVITGRELCIESMEAE
jgi:hydrogenase nickel incorporation protein HypA/HybF